MIDPSLLDAFEGVEMGKSRIYLKTPKIHEDELTDTYHGTPGSQSGGETAGWTDLVGAVPVSISVVQSRISQGQDILILKHNSSTGMKTFGSFRHDLARTQFVYLIDQLGNILELNRSALKSVLRNFI